MTVDCRACIDALYSACQHSLHTFNPSHISCPLTQYASHWHPPSHAPVPLERDSFQPTIKELQFLVSQARALSPHLFELLRYDNLAAAFVFRLDVSSLNHDPQFCLALHLTLALHAPVSSILFLLLTWAWLVQQAPLPGQIAMLAIADFPFWSTHLPAQYRTRQALRPEAVITFLSFPLPRFPCGTSASLHLSDACFLH